MRFSLVETFINPKTDLLESKTVTLEGETYSDIWEQIKTHPQHLRNLREHGKTAYRDEHGIIHRIYLTEIIGPH